MGRKSSLDPEFSGIARTWYWPVRSIGSLMIVVALSGLGLSAFSLRQGVSRSVPLTIRPVPVPIVLHQIPAEAPAAFVERPIDPFVIPADPGLDTSMVIKADPRIDAAMVFHLGPDGRLARATEEAALIPADPEPDMIPQP